MKFNNVSILTITFVLFAASTFAASPSILVEPSARRVAVNSEDAGTSAVIKGIVRSGGVGLIFTERELFVGENDGKAWRRINLNLGLSDGIAGAVMAADGAIHVVIANRMVGGFRSEDGRQDHQPSGQAHEQLQFYQWIDLYFIR